MSRDVESAHRPRPGQPARSVVEAGGLTFMGASVSAYTTFIVCRDIRVVFDMGSVIEEMLPIDHVLITHGHQDHLLGLTRYAGLRRLQHMKPPTVLLPAQIVGDVRNLFAAWQALESDGRREPPEVTFVPVEPGDEVPLAGNWIAKTFAVEHTLPAIGYTVVERTHKLRDEYRGSPGHVIADLRHQGVAVTRAVDRPLVTYFGDTLPGSLDRYPEMGASRVVIVECTFLKPEHLPLAVERGHLHIQHLIERIALFGGAEIVLTHFSRRYCRRDIEEHVRAQWPEEHRERLHVLL